MPASFRRDARCVQRAKRRLRLESLEGRVLLAADVIINELMADNDNTLLDGDGNKSDWIELYNSGDAPQDMAGWYLTDDPLLLTKWPLPADPSTVLGPDEYLVVFASGQLTNDYVDAGGNLHTNFRLDRAGEYLALVDDDGTTIVSELNPFPPQHEDVSYGQAVETTEQLLVGPNTDAKLLVPTQASDLPVDWHDAALDDTAWDVAVVGIGYQTLLGVPAPAPDEPLPDPVAHWPLDEGAGTVVDDISPGDHDGVLPSNWTTDTPPTAVANPFALTFDGDDDFVATGYPGIGGSAARSVAFWVKTTNTAEHGIVAWGNSTANGQKYHIRLNNNSSNGTVGAIRTEVQGSYRTGTTVIADGQWHHVVSVLPVGATNVNQVVHYVDGQLEGVSGGASQTINTDLSVDDVTIGRRRQTSNLQYLPGAIDDVRIYDTEISAADVTGLINSAAPRSANLVGHWGFDDGPGSATTADAGSGSNDGTLTNMTPAPTAVWVADAPADLAPQTDSLSFNGVDAYVSTEFAGVGGTSDRTVAFWVKSTDSDLHGLVAWGDSTGTGEKYFLRLNSIADNGPLGAIRTEVDSGYIIGSTNLADGQWHHVASVFDDDGTPNVEDVRHYVDGQLEAVGGVLPIAFNTDISSANARPVTLARSVEGSSPLYFDGQLADVRIYDQALSIEQIGQFVPGAPQGLLANWQFETGAGTTAVDTVGSFDGTLTNMAPDAWTGADPPRIESDFALQFDGVDDYVATSMPGVDATRARTVAFWINTTDTAGGIVAWGDDTTPGRRWHLYLDGDGRIVADAGGGSAVGTADVADGRWHHVVAMLPADGAPDVVDTQFYVDGHLDPLSAGTAAAVDTDTTSPAAQTVSVGRRIDGGDTHYFQGRLDEVRIIDGTLDADDIAQLAEPRAGFVPLTYWHLDQSAGATADETVGGFDGALADAPAVPVWQLDAPAAIPNTHSLLFDGVDDFVTTPFAGVAGSDPRTVAFWIKTTDTNDHGIVAWGNSNADGQKWHLRVNSSASNGNLGAIRTEIQGGYIIGTANVADGNWHHVVSVFPEDATPNIDDVLLYVDGVLDPISGVDPFAVNTLVGTGAQTVSIGRRTQTSNQRYFNGSVADVAIWEGPLSAEAAAALADGSIRPDEMVSFAEYIYSDVGDAMRSVNSSAFVRIPFTVDAPASLDRLKLKMRYDDGFVAYLNGTPVAQANAPGTPQWDSTATAERAAIDAVQQETFDITSQLGALAASPAVNVLALHAMNADAADVELLLDVELIGVEVDPQGLRFMPDPTPGGPNTAGVLGFVGDTTFSHDRGYYDAPLNVTITSATPDAAIYYTTDGSTPGATNPAATLYAAPIPVTTTTVLRARAFKDGLAPTNTDTQTYLFPLDVVAQSHQQALDAGWPTSYAGLAGDYEMDTTITGDPLYGPQVAAALRTHPVISLVTELENLVDPATGLLANPQAEGDAWERPISLELFDFADGGQIQVDAGLRINGGASRNANRRKHNMRLIFRDEYGPGQLEFPLFEDSPEYERFNSIILRGGNGDSFVNNVVYQRAQYIRDQWHRDMQVAMGQPTASQDYAHLYINGLYWGLYHTIERIDDDFMALHFGGEPQEYDVLKVTNQAPIEAADGNLDAWNAMMAIADGGTIDDVAYQEIQQYVDLDNFVDYVLLYFYSGNNDWDQNNVRAGRHRVEGAGFQFFAWDSERTDINALGPSAGQIGEVDRDVTGTDRAGNPTHLHQRLATNADYRIFFADRVQKHLFNNGALTPPAAAAAFQARADEIELAIIAESARWGDRHTSVARTQADWQAHLDLMMNTFFPVRRNIVVDQLSARGLVPDVDAPDFAQFGGEVTPGFTLAMSDPASPPVAEHVLYFTTNGADPRLPGGTVNAADATAYGTPLPINQTTTVKARIYNTSTEEWSALTEALFTVDVPLRVSEVMYNPPAPTVEEINAGYIDNDDFEFVELVNMSDADTIDLEGIAFTNGIAFTFGPGTLAPGERVLVVRDSAAFAARYDTTGMQIAGEYRDPIDGSNKLSNNGETLALVDTGGAPIQSFRYNDGNSWPQAADGEGSSLETIDLAGNLDEGASWYASPQWGGSPGALASAAVIERFLFYAGSTFDTVDDDAIAPDKQALLPGQTATVANVSSYSEGINGLVLDIARAVDANQIDENDFTFLSGNVDDVGMWTPLADLPTVSVRPGEGRGTSDRIVIAWAARESAVNTYLQVTLPAAATETGLAADDTFYFGSAVGETFNAPTNLLTTAADLIAIRDNSRGPSNRADLTSVHDINRDRLVDATDQLLARNNATGPFNALHLITPTLPPVAPPEAEGGIAASPLLASRASHGPGEVTPPKTTTTSPASIATDHRRFEARRSPIAPTPLDLVARARLQRPTSPNAAPHDAPTIALLDPLSVEF